MNEFFVAFDSHPVAFTVCFVTTVVSVTAGLAYFFKRVTE